MIRGFGRRVKINEEMAVMINDWRGLPDYLVAVTPLQYTSVHILEIVTFSKP